jgi:tripartite ATP-independent transporter DctP family solute receptor
MSLLCFAGPASAQTPKFDLSFANGFPLNHAVNLAYADFIKELEQRSNGEMTGTIFPSNQLGSDFAHISAIEDHSLAMMWAGTPPMASIVPELGVFDIPFAFTSVEQANKALSDPKFNELLNVKFEQKGFKLFGIDAYGFRWLSANKPVAKMEDLKGLKLRVTESPYHVAFWKALGVSPTPLSNSERYTALQQGTVDGQENLIENAFNTRMYEVQKYFVNTKHIVFCGVWAMDKQLWDEMSPEQQALVTELLTKYRAKSVELAVARENDLLSELENKYQRIVTRELPAEEYERWAKTARPETEQMVRDKVGNEIVDALLNAAKN